MPTKPRILLVDDDPDISLALLDYLRKEGFEVDLAETGTAALYKGTTHTYDVALLDVGLPDLDGIQVLAELADKKPELPIILLTAFTTLQKTTNPEIIDKAFAYLTKPYNREGVKATIERAIIRPVLPGGKDGTQLSLPQTVLPSPSFLQTKGSIASATSGPRYHITLQEYQRWAEYMQCMQFGFDCVPEVVLVADSEKRFRFANKAACKSLGYTREEMENLRIPDIAPDHDPQRYQNHLKALRQEHTLSYSTIHRTKNGQNFPTEISVYLLKFHGQEFTCAITKPIPHQPEEQRQGAKTI